MINKVWEYTTDVIYRTVWAPPKPEEFGHGDGRGDTNSSTLSDGHGGSAYFKEVCNWDGGGTLQGDSTALGSSRTEMRQCWGKYD